MITVFSHRNSSSHHNYNTRSDQCSKTKKKALANSICKGFFRVFVLHHQKAHQKEGHRNNPQSDQHWNDHHTDRIPIRLKGCLMRRDRRLCLGLFGARRKHPSTRARHIGNGRSVVNVYRLVFLLFVLLSWYKTFLLVSLGYQKLDRFCLLLLVLL